MDRFKLYVNSWMHRWNHKKDLLKALQGCVAKPQVRMDDRSIRLSAENLDQFS